MKIAILNHEIFAMYWKRNLQMRTPNFDVVRIFLMRAAERGENLTEYHVNSNFCPKYDVVAMSSDMKSEDIMQLAVNH